MTPGSVIVDLAVEAGGNVEGSRPGEIATTANGVKIIGHLNMPSRIAVDASQLYARNLLAFLALLVDKERQLHIDTSDEIIKAALLTHDGAVVNPASSARRPASRPSAGCPDHRVTAGPADGETMADPASLAQRASELAGDAGALARNLDALSQQLALATEPGMHGGAPVHLPADRLRARRLRRLLRRLAGDAGAAFAADERHQRGVERHHRRRDDRGRPGRASSFAKIMGFIAVTLAAVNIFGGFIVTQRMLQMFQRKR